MRRSMIPFGINEISTFSTPPTGRVMLETEASKKGGFGSFVAPRREYSKESERVRAIVPAFLIGSAIGVRGTRRRGCAHFGICTTTVPVRVCIGISVLESKKKGGEKTTR